MRLGRSWSVLGFRYFPDFTQVIDDYGTVRRVPPEGVTRAFYFAFGYWLF